jgi:hypothetical protein
MGFKYTFVFVKKYFNDNNYILIEKEYINCETKMKYICPLGHQGEIAFSSFKRGYRCLECSGNKKHSLEYIKNYFKDNNCILLEQKYKNSTTNMKYICWHSSLDYLLKLIIYNKL